ncbi:MAG: DUF5686 and carboxypeptidase regulatory-like domain-containing protein [Bacteroidales bacterium]|jgi:hypothetical protein|nr:DUF5686 and carboxypeptidase regulatory-like domain-containing protein [Bacteroidales bacterium]
MMIKKAVRFIFVIFILILPSGYVCSQTLNIRGTVTDAATGETMPYASVVVQPASFGVGVMTDIDGKYSIEIKVKGESLLFSFVGYESVLMEWNTLKSGTLNVKMKPLATQLNAVEVTAKRVRYSKRNNPAVDLIRKAIANKDKNRLESKPTYTYKRQEKILLSLNELSDSVKNSAAFRSFAFLNNYLDTLPETGTYRLPVFLREQITEHYYRQSPKAEKDYLIASKMANFHDLIEQETIGAFMDGMVGKSNIYDNRIMVLENEYMSPMSPLAPTFYHFHIRDTVDVNGTSCIDLSVYPSNPQDFGFAGDIYITNDSAYALKRAVLAFTKNANVNFVNNFLMIQEYSLIDDTWCLTLDEVTIDFSFSKTKSMMLGKRTNFYSDYHFNHHIQDNVFFGINKVEKMPGYDIRPDQYWEDERIEPLTRQEQGVYDMIVDMKNDKWFNRILNFAGIMFSSYIDVGKVDLGPTSTVFSFNDVEGFRLRFGGKTNVKFSKHLFFDGYGAYGFKDEKFKYHLKTMYSFNERKVHPWEYPMNLLTLSYENNIETPGQFFLFGSPDRLFLSFHRGSAQQMVYHRTFSAIWEKEFLSGFSFQPFLTHRIETPTGSLVYTNNDGDIERIITTQLGMKLRFAPNERFYQIQRNRFPLNHTHPVFTLTYNCGLKNIWNGQYSFHRLEAAIDKRSWFSSLGFADMWLRAGKVWGTVPIPLLVMHQANQNYAYQDEAFNMMNYMEFVSDRYAVVNLSYCFNGWIFNRVPLIKKLKWREFVTFKALWGDVSDSNLPANNPELFRFPENPDGIPTMYALGKKPYMEASVAIDNVFKFLRIDFIKRLNYLDHLDVPEWGVRFRLRFVF